MLASARARCTATGWDALGLRKRETPQRTNHIPLVRLDGIVGVNTTPLFVSTWVQVSFMPWSHEDLGLTDMSFCFITTFDKTRRSEVTTAAQVSSADDSRARTVKFLRKGHCGKRVESVARSMQKSERAPKTRTQLRADRPEFSRLFFSPSQALKCEWLGMAPLGPVKGIPGTQTPCYAWFNVLGSDRSCTLHDTFQVHCLIPATSGTRLL